MFLKKKYGENSVVSLFMEKLMSKIEKKLLNAYKKIRLLKLDFGLTLVGNPTTGGFGLTLTACNTVIYFSNNYNLRGKNAIRG